MTTLTTAPALADRHTSSANRTVEVADNLTIREAFSHDPQLMADVLDSQYLAKRLTPEDSLADLRRIAYSLTIHIHHPITDYQDLLQLKGVVNRLVIRNQTNLSGANLKLILGMFPVDDAANPNWMLNNIDALALVNDGLDNTDFATIVAFLKSIPKPVDAPTPADFDWTAISSLNLSNNNITDLSLVKQIYQFDNPKTNQVNFFTAWGQHHPSAKRLPTTTVTDHTIAIDPKVTQEYQLDKLNRYTTNSLFFNFSRKSSFYYRIFQDDLDGTETLASDDPEKIVDGVTTLPDEGVYPAYGSRNLTVDGHLLGNGRFYNSLSYAFPEFQPLAEPEDMDKLSDLYTNAGFTLTEPLSSDTYVVKVPDGADTVRFRTMYLNMYSAAQTGYTQDYEIPLKWTSSSSSSSSSSGSSSSSSSGSSSSSSSSGGGGGITPKGAAVYGLKKIGLYNDTHFTKKARLHFYRKQPRINRPMFRVTGYAKSPQGRLRYLVKDVNHHSKTAGKTGYITASPKYVGPVYYRQVAKTITVINPQGINAYRKKNLTGKVTHYRQGQMIKVKRLVSHNLTTRYVLPNGRYITANKKLIRNGCHPQAKRIVTKHGVNRYRDRNLRHRQRHYRRGTVLTVTGWDYSDSGKLRYRVKGGGYVTGNRELVRVVK
ncbi:hypothetical protein IV54_GL001027 [Levilactobacillus paucivorans]|uniref:DUF5776 domain-containing protein n=1 Tax=Levilactobacillus paucivorans TaxID=616990 RepID=A0A0R2LSG6_9LACO|nr:hypothetical protein IV54_GL001027 [Levilactobacillus paucivorans]